MRTLAMTAALATALTGTGCIVTADPNGDLDLAWNFQNSSGLTAGSFTAASSGCGVAGITDVDLTLWDAYNNRVVFRNFLCEEAGSGLPRAYVTGLATGTYQYLATAYRIDAPVFEEGGQVVVHAGAGNQYDVTLPVLATAPLTVWFTQRGSFTCAGTPNVRFDLYSGATLLETSTVPCTASHGFTATADHPTGYDYSVDIFALDPGVPPPAISINERCLQTVHHTGFPATIDLLTSPQPGCGP